MCLPSGEMSRSQEAWSLSQLPPWGYVGAGSSKGLSDWQEE